MPQPRYGDKWRQNGDKWGQNHQSPLAPHTHPWLPPMPWPLPTTTRPMPPTLWPPLTTPCSPLPTLWTPPSTSWPLLPIYAPNSKNRDFWHRQSDISCYCSNTKRETMQFMLSLARAILAHSRTLNILFLCEILVPEHVTEYPYPQSKMVKIAQNPIFGIGKVVFPAPVSSPKD